MSQQQQQDEDDIQEYSRRIYTIATDLDQVLRYLTSRLDGRQPTHDKCAKALNTVIAAHSATMAARSRLTWCAAR